MGARALLEKICTKEETLGCPTLGIMYLDGDGAPKDAARGRTILELGCDGGSAVSCYDLGVVLETGKGVAKDATRAASFYKKACDASYAEACDAATRLASKPVMQ